MTNNIALFDTHAHISDDRLADVSQDLLSRAKENHIQQLVNICTNLSSLERGLSLAEQHPNYLLNSASTTPHDVEKEGALLFPKVQEAAEKKQLIAIGETGLDYYYTLSPKEIQKEYLVKYAHLAQEYQLPLIIHCRDAFDDLFSILDQEYAKEAPLILHCFTGTLQEAEQVVARGWYLSLSGIVTFKKSGELRNVAAMVPDNQLLIETDTPYLAPHPYRGKQNEPAYLIETAKVIAAERSTSLENLAKQTFSNAQTCFALS